MKPITSFRAILMALLFIPLLSCTDLFHLITRSPRLFVANDNSCSISVPYDWQTKASSSPNVRLEAFDPKSYVQVLIYSMKKDGARFSSIEQYNDHMTSAFTKIYANSIVQDVSRNSVKSRPTIVTVIKNPAKDHDFTLTSIDGTNYYFCVVGILFHQPNIELSRSYDIVARSLQELPGKKVDRGS